jgi:4-amino-4-deoxychorismate lyase
MRIQYLINGRSGQGISPMDRGFAYGDGVFRTLPMRNGKLKDWELHYRRLQSDCAVLKIACPPEAQWLDDIRQLSKGVDEAVFKLMVTRGESGRGYAVPPVAQPNRVVIQSPFPVYPATYDSDGVGLHLCQLRLAEQPKLAGIKHLNRLENVLARMEWVEATYAEGLLLDASGNVIECTMSNLFMRRGNVLVTPDLTRCGVAGVTRQRILDQAGMLGLQAEVARFDLATLQTADEVVICNSLLGVWQVRSIEKKSWPKGDLAQQLREALDIGGSTFA